MTTKQDFYSAILSELARILPLTQQGYLSLQALPDGQGIRLSLQHLAADGSYSHKSALTLHHHSIPAVLHFLHNLPPTDNLNQLFSSLRSINLSYLI